MMEELTGSEGLRRAGSEADCRAEARAERLHEAGCMRSLPRSVSSLRHGLARPRAGGAGEEEQEAGVVAQEAPRELRGKAPPTVAEAMRVGGALFSV